MHFAWGIANCRIHLGHLVPPIRRFEVVIKENGEKVNQNNCPTYELMLIFFSQIFFYKMKIVQRMFTRMGFFRPLHFMAASYGQKVHGLSCCWFVLVLDRKNAKRYARFHLISMNKCYWSVDHRPHNIIIENDHVHWQCPNINGISIIQIVNLF